MRGRCGWYWQILYDGFTYFSLRLLAEPKCQKFTDMRVDGQTYLGIYPRVKTKAEREMFAENVSLSYSKKTYKKFPDPFVTEG